jgi:hypothetical protein
MKLSLDKLPHVPCNDSFWHTHVHTPSPATFILRTRIKYIGIKTLCTATGHLSAKPLPTTAFSFDAPIHSRQAQAESHYANTDNSHDLIDHSGSVHVLQRSSAAHGAVGYAVTASGGQIYESSTGRSNASSADLVCRGMLFCE